MAGRFMTKSRVKTDRLDWGAMAWHSRPATTGAKRLVVMEVTLAPDGGHNFHKHPGQEESIYVIEGAIEQWLDRRRQVLKAGESVFIAAGQVHASFNVFKRAARLLVTLGPCKGRAGYGLVDVAGQAPWNKLRR